MSFEHLGETQSALAERLRAEFENSLIPQSLLFSGPAYSSRMTAAIETALAFMGQSDKFDTLVGVNDLVILSRRDNEIRYRAAYELYKKHKTSFCFNFLIRTARTFLFAYHPALINSGDKAVFSLAADVSDQLYLNPREEEREAWCEELHNRMNKLFSKTRGKAGFTIDNVRDLAAFFQQGTSVKVAILEGIEDMNPSAVNSLLKMLEEPAPNSHIILISSHPERILETILSRVRKYEFKAISDAESQTFLQKYFYCFEKGLSIEEFFYKSSLFDFEKAGSLASAFVNTLLIGKRNAEREEIEEIGSFLDSSSAYPLFITLVSKECEKLFLEGKLNEAQAERTMSILSSSYSDSAVYNQNKRVLLDRLSRELSE